MKRIKDFNSFNESLEVYAPKMPYMGTQFIQSMKDPDEEKKDVEGNTLTPKVPQFDAVKTITIILSDGNLSVRAAQIFPDTDLTQAVNNPNMLGPEENTKLIHIYNDIILKDYVLRQKYDLLEDMTGSNYTLDQIKDGEYKGSIKGYEVYMDSIDSGFRATTGYRNMFPIPCMVVIKDGHACVYSKGGILFSDKETENEWREKYGKGAEGMNNDPDYVKYKDTFK